MVVLFGRSDARMFSAYLTVVVMSHDEASLFTTVLGFCAFQ